MFDRLHVTQVVSGQVTVTTGGTRVQFPDVPCSGVYLSALPGNTNPVVIGGVGVVAAAGSENGIILKVAAGYAQNVFIPVTNLNRLYADAVTNGEKVSYLAVK